MKRGILVGIFALVLSIGGLAFAQGPGMWGGGYGGGPGWGGGYGMGPGMMGPGYGYGYGPGMMGPGYGGGYGMMGPGWGGRQGYGLSEECQKYFDESAGKRKELHVKQFEYSEAMRNPKTKPEHVTKLEKEIWDLQKEIYTNAPQSCR